jgi:mannobiose 2-epimerase
VPAPQEKARVRALLERMLLENIVPFWERTTDREFGGYRFNHDPQGTWLGPGWKTAANQARMLCYYALLNRSPHRTPASLEAARHGVDILAGPLWDDRHGGFFWAVDHTARRVLAPEKHVLAQAYGLYALAEHCRSVSDPRALALAQRVFGLIVTNMKDRRYGGYSEGFSRSWRPQSIFRRNAMAKGPRIKSMSAHMNLMSAMNHLYRVTGATEVRHELHELVLIQSNAVASKQVATSSSHFRDDWQAADSDHTSAPYFDHDLKNIWQLISACDALSIPAWVLGGLFRAQFAAAVRFGHDPVHGGFFTPPRFKRPGAPREKDWWTQAEGLVSALHLYVLFGRGRVLDALPVDTRLDRPVPGRLDSRRLARVRHRVRHPAWQQGRTLEDGVSQRAGGPDLPRTAALIGDEPPRSRSARRPAPAVARGRHAGGADRERLGHRSQRRPESRSARGADPSSPRRAPARRVLAVRPASRHALGRG